MSWPILACKAFDLALVVARRIAAAAFERPRRLLRKLLLPGINRVGVDLIALGQLGHRRLLP